MATVAPHSSATLEKNRVYCPHCDKKLSKTTFYAHKRLYFNQLTRKWSKSRVNFTPSTAVEDDVTRMEDLDQLPGFSEEKHDEEAPFDFDLPQESLQQAEQSSGTRTYKHYWEGYLD